MLVFADHHHSSLTRSLVMLFQDRLGAEIFRPIGMSWFTNGYWAINNLEDTARQFLDPDCQAVADGTPPLNVQSAAVSGGVYNIYDPGNVTTHKAVTFDAFKDMKFDYVIASIPEHILPFQRLIAKYQPQAKLVIQVGNNWHLELLAGHNILASVKSVYGPHNTNVCYYRQEFDTNIFCPPDEPPEKPRISSYINVLQEWPVGFGDFNYLESQLREHGIEMKSFGGQCRDGNFAGPHALAESMKQDSMIFHVKDYGDGFGHIAHNALACGVPLIVRGRFTRGTLIADLLNDSFCIDLDLYTAREGVDEILSVFDDSYALASLREQARNAFVKNVDFAADAKRVGEWLRTLV